MNILFATSEVYPLVKTGGLADVSASLPRALLQLNQDVRIILPAYQSVMEKINKPKIMGECVHYGYSIQLLQTTLPGTRIKVYLVDCAPLFDRPGNPYLNPMGEEWQDNALRFALFNQVIVDVALNRLGLDWSVDLVHCNDWQSGLTPALLEQFETPPATLFTVHNLAYQGLYSKNVFFDLGLPHTLWTYQGVEFHELFSFIKGGLNFSDCINTVSPQYAHEIQTEEFGYGLESIFQFRQPVLSGILNGIDSNEWNPGTDKFLAENYNQRSLAKKQKNKRALQKRMGLKIDAKVPLIGLISRLVEQKGLDMILGALPDLLNMPLQFVFLGSGEPVYEKSLQAIARIHSESVAVFIGYDEALAHQVEAGSDIYLMPSLFEPCGLNQLYSLRYGTLPLVTQVGGLADSVIDYDGENLQQANGFMLKERNSAALIQAVKRACALYHKADEWKTLQLNGMQQDHSWKKSADEYLQLYQRAVALNT